MSMVEQKSFNFFNYQRIHFVNGSLTVNTLTHSLFIGAMLSVQVYNVSPYLHSNRTCIAKVKTCILLFMFMWCTRPVFIFLNKYDSTTYNVKLTC